MNAHSFMEVKKMDSLEHVPRINSQRKENRTTNSSEVGQVLHRALSDMYHQDICTDFEVIVDKKTFRCHKVVLAALSDYFRGMFSSGMKETVSNQVTLEDMNPRIFEIILELIYTNDDRHALIPLASEEEMTELLRVAEMLQMKFLIDKCCLYFKATMSPTNSIERWKMAKSILNEEVEKMAWDFLLKNFEAVVSLQMITSLDLQDFMDVIEDDHLSLDNEETVWRAVYDWVKFDQPNRKCHMVDLLKLCCLTEIGEDVLLEDIAFNPLIRESEGGSSLVLKAIQYRRHPAIQSSSEVKLRNCMDKEQMLVVMGKKVVKKSMTATQTIFRSLKQKKLITVRPLADAKRGLAMCVHGSTIYVTNDKNLFEYKAEKDTWEKRKPMLEPIRGHTMAVTDDSLFVIGGSSGHEDSSRVYEYEIKRDSWNIHGEILVAVRDASSVCIKNKVYIFGGKMGVDQFVDSIQEYDISTSESTILCHLPTPSRFSRAIRRDGAAYVVTSEGDVIHFTPDSVKPELIGTIPRFSRTNFGIEMRDNVLYVFGGRNVIGLMRRQKLYDSSDSENEGDMVEELECPASSIDVISGQITECKPFPFPMEVFGCDTIVVSRQKICD